MSFFVSIDKRNKYYNSIAVIINWLIKIMYYKIIKDKINVTSLTKTIFNIIVKYFSILDIIISY